MKTMLLWCPKGRRKPIMLGLATATCSAANIHHARRRAKHGQGRFYVVHAATAADARDLIKDHRAGQLQNQPMVLVTDDGRTVAIGLEACLAIGGAADACARWDDRIRQHGSVPVRHTKALTGDIEADIKRATSRGIGGMFE